MGRCDLTEIEILLGCTVDVISVFQLYSYGFSCRLCVLSRLQTGMDIHVKTDESKYKYLS